VKSPKVRTVLVSVALIMLALLWETFALTTSEGSAWTFSRLVWSLTDSELFVFASGILAGHFFFPKTRCLHCGFMPYRRNYLSERAFDRALMEFALEFNSSVPTLALPEAKRTAGFPDWRDF
jgi:hypothetical protein